MKTREIQGDMVKTLGEDSPCYSTVKTWIAVLSKAVRARTGGPKSVTMDAQLEGIYRTLMNDRRVTVRHIANTLGIIVMSVHTALTVILR